MEPAKVGHSCCQMSVVIFIFLFMQPSLLKLQVFSLEGLNVAVS